MPKLWRETIETHRREVRDAILDTAVGLVAKDGPASVTMSQIAEETGIGRATLYKYFPDVESILAAWHERQVDEHLAQLAAVRDGAGGPRERLEAVLGAYALMVHEARRHHGTALGELAARLHGEHGGGGHEASHDHGTHHGAHHAGRRGDHGVQHHGRHVARAQRQLGAFLGELLAEAAAAGDVRGDVGPEELAGYCLHALSAAGDLPSKAAVTRLVAVTLDGLRHR